MSIAATVLGQNNQNTPHLSLHVPHQLHHCHYHAHHHHHHCHSFLSVLNPGSEILNAFIMLEALSVMIWETLSEISRVDMVSSYLCLMFSAVWLPLNLLQAIMTDFIFQSLIKCPVMPMKAVICRLVHRSIVKQTLEAPDRELLT